MHNTLNSKQLAVRLTYPVWGGLFICFARYMHMGYRIFGHFPVFLLGSQEVQQRNNQTPGYIPSITGRSYCGNNGIATTRCNVQTQCHETILIFSKFYHLRGIAWPYPQEWVHYGSFPHIWLVVSPYFPTFCNISLINFPDFPILWWMNSIAFLWHPRARFGSFGCSAATCSDVAKPAPVHPL